MVIESALDPWLQRLLSRRFGITPRARKHPRPQGEPEANHESARNTAPSSSENAPRARRHLAQHARREVATRDGLCCSFVSQDGRRCKSRAFLQLHHEKAWAKGGSDEAGNLGVLCAAQRRSQPVARRARLRRGAHPTRHCTPTALAGEAVRCKNQPCPPASARNPGARPRGRCATIEGRWRSSQRIRRCRDT